MFLFCHKRLHQSIIIFENQTLIAFFDRHNFYAKYGKNIEICKHFSKKRIGHPKRNARFDNVEKCLRALLDSQFMCGGTIVGDDANHIDARAEAADVELSGMSAGQHIASVNIENLHIDNAFTLHGYLIVGRVGIDDGIGIVCLFDTDGASGGYLDVVEDDDITAFAIEMTEGDAEIASHTAGDGNVALLEVCHGGIEGFFKE